MIEKSGLKRNFAILLLSQGYSQGLLALTGLVVVRLLGPEEYGRYTLAVTGLNIAAVVADAGLSAYLNREAARLDEDTGRRLWALSLRVRLALSLALWLALLGLAAVWTQFGQPLLVGLAGLSLFPLSVTILTSAYLNGRGRVPLNSSLNAAVNTLGFALLVAGLIWQPFAGMALAVTLVTNILGALLVIRLLFGGNFKMLWAAGRKDGLTLLKASQSFFYISLASIGFQYLDIYLVSILLGETAVGHYGAALRLLAIVTTLPTVWGVAALPRFARQPEKLRSELVRWGWGLAAGGLLIAFVGFFLAEPAVHLLLGSKYDAAGDTLAWLLWAGAGIFASAAPVTWLTITNRQRLVLLALIMADLLGVALVVVLVGVFRWGLEGVALARITASWGLCGLYLLFRNFSNREQPTL